MKAYPFFSVAVFTAAISIFSCSSSDNPSEGEGNSQNYNYCLLNEDKMCLDGPFTSKDCTSAGGKPSNSCPYGGVEPSSSSVDGGQTGGDLSSSSQGASSSSEGDGQGGGSSSSNGGGQGGVTNPDGSVTYGGKTYKTVKIGDQVWFAENLNYAVEGGKCYGENGIVNGIVLSAEEVQTNCTKYGRLYDWATTMKLPSICNSNSCERSIQPKHQGICPDGWHIPSEEEWNILVNHAGVSETAGAKLKAAIGWNDYNGVSGNGTDEYEFSALPGGYGNSGGSFGDVGYGGSWWSASEGENYSDRAYYWDMDYNIEVANRFNGNKSYMYSVRCLKD